MIYAIVASNHYALRETSISGEVNGIQHYVIKFTVKNGSSEVFVSVLTLFPRLTQLLTPCLTQLLTSCLTQLLTPCLTQLLTPCLTQWLTSSLTQLLTPCLTQLFICPLIYGF